LARLPAVREAAAQGLLTVDPVRLTPENWFTTGAAKRTLIDRRPGAIDRMNLIAETAGRLLDDHQPFVLATIVQP